MLPSDEEVAVDPPTFHSLDFAALVRQFPEAIRVPMTEALRGHFMCGPLGDNDVICRDDINGALWRLIVSALMLI